MPFGKIKLGGTDLQPDTSHDIFKDSRQLSNKAKMQKIVHSKFLTTSVPELKIFLFCCSGISITSFLSIVWTFWETRKLWLTIEISYLLHPCSFSLSKEQMTKNISWVVRWKSVINQCKQENEWSVKMVAERSWDPALPHCFCRWNLCLQKPRKSKIWMVLKDAHLPLNSIVTTMASFYIIDTFDQRKKKKWLGRYFVYTVAKFCLSCLISQNHTVYS